MCASLTFFFSLSNRRDKLFLFFEMSEKGDGDFFFL